MNSWNSKKFKKLYDVNVRDAYKYVATHNKSLIKKEIINVPKTLSINKDNFKIDLKNTALKGYKESKLIFIDNDISLALYYLVSGGYNVAVLNLCDNIEPGAMYGSGYDGSEEELCRVCPGLQVSLSKSGMYPFGCYEKILYTSGVEYYRDFKQNYERFDDIKNINVISAACPDIKKSQSFDKHKVYNIIEMIFFTPKIYDNKINALLLTAWNTKHDIIASIYNSIISKYKNCYKLICFAISQGDVYKIYSNEFKKINK